MPFYAIQRPTGAHAIYRCALTTFGVPTTNSTQRTPVSTKGAPPVRAERQPLVTPSNVAP
ncbi:MAG: hypothetical protein IJD27_01525, partial [Alistipes sp.]|nr:hypothetical protein [Alistipes sp.]